MKKSFRNNINVSNSLDPDQARHFVGPDLGPNCLEKLSADDTSRYKVKTAAHCIFVLLSIFLCALIKRKEYILFFCADPIDVSIDIILTNPIDDSIDIT